MVDLTLSADEADLLDLAAGAAKCDWLYLEERGDAVRAIDLEDNEKPMEVYNAILLVSDAFGDDPALHIGAAKGAELEALRQRALRAEKVVKTIGYEPYMFDLDFRDENGRWFTVHIIGNLSGGTVVWNGWFIRSFKPRWHSYVHVAEAALLALGYDPKRAQCVIRRVWEPDGHGVGVMSFK